MVVYNTSVACGSWKGEKFCFPILNRQKARRKASDFSSSPHANGIYLKNIALCAFINIHCDDQIKPLYLIIAEISI